MYHFSNDRMARPKSRGDWVNSQRSGFWGTEQFPLSISSCPSAGFITDICTHWLHSRDRKLILHGLPFTGALLRNLKMLEGTRFTSNLIQKLGRGCVCVCVCVCACVCVLVRILTQLCLTLCNPVVGSLPGSSVWGIFPGKNTGVGCHFLHQGIFQTQGSNLGLLHCRQIRHRLSNQGDPRRGWTGENSLEENHRWRRMSRALGFRQTWVIMSALPNMSQLILL